MYIRQAIQLALSLENAFLRNERRSLLNKHMNIISHLISVYKPKFDLNAEKLFINTSFF